MVLSWLFSSNANTWEGSFLECCWIMNKQLLESDLLFRTLVCEYENMDADTFQGPISLHTTDNCIKAPVITNFAAGKKVDLTARIIYKDGRQILATVNNVLTLEESENVIKNSEKHGFESMTSKYTSSQRNNSRALLLDHEFSSALWAHLEPCVSRLLGDSKVTCQPLGFDVCRGDWQLDGLNEAFRINKYCSNGEQFFSPHKDSQYCPNGDRRSLLTLLVYLKDDFKKGSTCFYFPKDKSLKKDLSIEEELESSGGLRNGYLRFVVQPSLGKAVIFSHDIIHESVPVAKGTKYVLKTDIVVARQTSGFSVSDAEQEDYMKCLNYFREAQQLELRNSSLKAGELYEKALSIRYCYPMSLQSQNSMHSKHGDDLVSMLPSMIWYEIFNRLSGYDIENLVRAYQQLDLTRKSWEKLRFRQDEKKQHDHKLKFIPTVQLQYGIYTKFQFDDADFFSKNDIGCIRVAAMYAFFLLSHKADDRVYTVRYDPENQEVCAVALHSLLTDAFLNRPCYGSIYAVKQTDARGKLPAEDFAHSVDRNYMRSRYATDVGISLQASFHSKTYSYLLGTQWYDFKVESESDSDSEPDTDDSDNEADDEGLEDEVKDSLSSNSHLIDASNFNNKAESNHEKTTTENSKEWNEHTDSTSLSRANKEMSGGNIECKTALNSTVEEKIERGSAEEEDTHRKESFIAEDSKEHDTCIAPSCNTSSLPTIPTQQADGSGSEKETCFNSQSPSPNRDLITNTKISSTDDYENSYVERHFASECTKDFQDRFTLYKGYDERSEDSDFENYDAELTEYYKSEAVDSYESLVEDIKDHVRSGGVGDYFVYQYDGNTDIVESDCVLNEVIYQSNLTQTFHRQGKELPENISEGMMERAISVIQTGQVTPDEGDQQYYQGLMRKVCRERPGVSATLVSALKKPVVVMNGSMCFCYWPGGEGYDRVRRGCRTDFYNHLVFDFLEKEMNITKTESCKADEQCFYDKYYDAFIKEEVRELISPFHYTVNIENLLKKNTGFNHASCNCHVPAFKIMEYSDFKSYPHLNHIHIVGGEADGRVVAWAVYGGIVAL